MDNITKVASAAGVKVEPLIVDMFCKALLKTNLDTLISSIGASSSSTSAPVVQETKAAVEEPKKAVQKEESEEEVEFDLFD